jgi:CheY-like chemotaxis protein
LAKEEALAGRFLIVAHDAAVRELYRSIITASGGGCASAADVVSARRLLAGAEGFDAVLMDVGSESEWQACAALSRAATRAGTPLVLSTSSISPERRHRCRPLEAGCAALIGRPFTAQTLTETLDSVVRGERGIGFQGVRRPASRATRRFSARS